ncbi:hypothetical protein Tco_1487288 [Tanacetum coccineum]
MRIVAGDYEDVMEGMTSDERKAVMEAIEKLLAEVTSNMPNATVSNNIIGCPNVSMVTSNVDDSVPSLDLPFEDSPIVQYVFIQSKPNSYARVAGASTSKPSKAKANFCSLYFENLCKGVDFTIPKKVFETVSTRFDNTLYGYFIGKRVAFSDCRVFSEDGISLIASQIGKPIMLDSYTSSMCIKSWGRSSFARCLIEINANDALKEGLTMGVPLIDDSGFSIETVCISGNHLVVIYRKNGKTGSNKGVKFGGQLAKPNVNGSQNGKNGGTHAKEKVTSPYDPSNIPVSNLYACLNEESEEEVENVFDESANLLSSAKSGASYPNFMVPDV